MPFRLEAIKDATLIFRGRVVGYSPAVGATHAEIDFNVVETYRGKRHDTLRLTWPNSTFETPKTWWRPVNLIVAAAPDWMLSPSSKDRLAVFQEACSEAFLLDDTPAMREKVRTLIGSAR